MKMTVELLDLGPHARAVLVHTGNPVEGVTIALPNDGVGDSDKLEHKTREQQQRDIQLVLNFAITHLLPGA